MKAIDIADLIIHRCQEEGVTHSKLQKLLYYVQGFYLALYKKTLFEEAIIACPNGTLIKSVEDVYQNYLYEDIPWRKISLTDVNPDIQGVVHDVCFIFQAYNSRAMEQLIKTEEPWIKARNGRNTYDSGVEIDVSDMKTYFSKEYVKQSSS